MKAIFTAVLLFNSTAFAAGAVLAEGSLSQESSSQLSSEISAARLRDPGAFEALRQVHGRLGELDARKRGRTAPIASVLRALGDRALWPMVDQLAFDGLPRDGLADSAWHAWRTGLVEAVGDLREPQLRDLFVKLVEQPADSGGVTRAAVNGLGLLGDDDSLAQLLRLARGPNRPVLLAGLGYCRRLSAAEELARAARSQDDAASLKAIIQSLSDVGNAWAWQTPAATARSEEAAVRSTAARALLQVFLKQDGNLRAAASNGLMVVDAKETVALIEGARSQATPEQSAALDELAARFASNPTR